MSKKQKGKICVFVQGTKLLCKIHECTATEVKKGKGIIGAEIFEKESAYEHINIWLVSIPFP